MTPHRSPWPLVTAIGLTVIIGVSGWATNDSRHPSAPAAPDRPAPHVSYVALGDSYTAGGPIGAPQPASGTCLRSTANYPSIVAHDLNYRLTDVSCVGATTNSVLEGTKALAPQVDALSDKAKLVTVSVGGNDLRMFADVFMTCSTLR